MRFPTAYSVLMLVIVVAAGATWLLPAGRYDTLTYDSDRNSFIVARASGEHRLPATEAVLDSLGVRIALSEFLSGSIRKPVSIPGTYHRVEPKRQGVFAVAVAPILGIQDAIDVILFVLVIGGFIAVFSKAGAFAAGIHALARRLRGRESWLIIIVTTLMALGGTTYGMAEETFAFYPLLVPVFLAAGYDALVPLAVIFAGSHIGFMASTTNPFSVIIASDAAGVSWTNGLTARIIMWFILVGVTIAYILRYARRVKAAPERSLVATGTQFQPEEAPAMAVEAPAPEHVALTPRRVLLLVLFGLTFVVMIVGVSRLGWWFNEMTALFFVAALIAALIERLGEAELVATFLAGAKELLGVAFIIGFARGATIVLDRGDISATVVYHAAGFVEQMPGVAFIVGVFFVYAGLTLFIASSSGMAVLTMPIMGTLAGVAGVPSEQIVNAYMYGMGVMFFLTPTGLILPSLAMVKVGYGTWLRFVLPLLGWITIAAIIFLAVGVMA